MKKFDDSSDRSAAAASRFRPTSRRSRTSPCSASVRIAAEHEVGHVANLFGYGVAAVRLSAHGAGPLAPVASNLPRKARPGIAALTWSSNKMGRMKSLGTTVATMLAVVSRFCGRTLSSPRRLGLLSLNVGDSEDDFGVELIEGASTINPAAARYCVRLPAGATVNRYSGVTKRAGETPTASTGSTSSDTWRAPARARAARRLRRDRRPGSNSRRRQHRCTMSMLRGASTGLSGTRARRGVTIFASIQSTAYRTNPNKSSNRARLKPWRHRSNTGRRRDGC